MKNLSPIALALFGLILSTNAMAQDRRAEMGVPMKRSAVDWMSKEVGVAWDQGFKGKGVTITVVDDFRGSTFRNGQLGTDIQRLRPGDWAAMEASMVAPLADVVKADVNNPAYKWFPVQLKPGLNVINLSYGLEPNGGYTLPQIRRAHEASIIGHARSGRAVISKAAGNDGVPVLSRNSSGYSDYLNHALKGLSTVIYVGALSTNGTTARPAGMASYSNTAGHDSFIQKNFLVVGVEGYNTALNGTQFAAPVISGYAAILGSKFKTATPRAITNQLLNTARQDTIKNYSIAVHGRGEASLTRALAPVAIR